MSPAANVRGDGTNPMALPMLWIAISKPTSTGLNSIAIATAGARTTTEQGARSLAKCPMANGSKSERVRVFSVIDELVKSPKTHNFVLVTH